MTTPSTVTAMHNCPAAMSKEQHRSITLIRHAKSSWDHPGLSDFARPLNKRGNRDAPRVGQYLAEAGIRFDLVLCSEAERAKQTLRGLRSMLELHDDEIMYREDLYLASANTIRSIIAEQPAGKRDIAVIAHNPGLENLAWEFSGRSVDRMPTCCVVRFVFDDIAGDWQKALAGSAKCELYLLPRELD